MNLDTALILGKLIGLDKRPGLRLLGVGETWRRMLGKCVLVVTEAEAKEACRTEQLCGGLEMWIEGGIHALRLLLQHNAHE